MSFPDKLIFQLIFLLNGMNSHLTIAGAISSKNLKKGHEGLIGWLGKLGVHQMWALFLGWGLFVSDVGRNDSKPNLNSINVASLTKVFRKLSPCLLSFCLFAKLRTFGSRPHFKPTTNTH